MLLTDLILIYTKSSGKRYNKNALPQWGQSSVIFQTLLLETQSIFGTYQVLKNICYQMHALMNEFVSAPWNEAHGLAWKFILY